MSANVHESQLRPLVGLPLDQAQLAWECAAQMARGGKVTARIVKIAVKELGFGEERAEATNEPRPNRTQQRRIITTAFGELLTLLQQKAAHTTLLEKAEALHAQVQAFFPVLKPKR